MYSTFAISNKFIKYYISSNYKILQTFLSVILGPKTFFVPGLSTEGVRATGPDVDTVDGGLEEALEDIFGSEAAIVGVVGLEEFTECFKPELEEGVLAIVTTTISPTC